MKLKAFSPTDFKSAHRSKPSININSKSGTFTFSKAAVQMLGVSENNPEIVIYQDEDRPQDWYLSVVTPNKDAAFKLRKKTDDSMIFNCSGLAQKIFQDCKHSKLSGTVLIGAYDEENKVYPIITSSLKTSL